MATLTMREVPPGGVVPGGWSQEQLDTIILFERLGAAFSLTGLVMIFLAFAAFKRLRTVPNTFIVFASVSNLGASIACLIGYSGILEGLNSSLCQVQGFLFELFMQSDPWWSFAMAVNVYMVFFLAASPHSFLKYWYVYFIVCYGIPFIPAIWLLVAHNQDGSDVYGNATIWCWIGNEQSGLRIYTYYLPVWVCIILSAFVYIAVGYYVFKQRNQLRNLSLSNPPCDPPATRDSGEKDLFVHAAGMGRTNREVIQVTTVNTASEQTRNAIVPAGSATPMGWYDGPSENQLGVGSAQSAAAPSPFVTTVTHITADPAPPKDNIWRRTRVGFDRWCSKFNHLDPVKLAYMRTSFIFAISVLITWTPSSINRVHDLVDPANTSFSLNLASAIVLPLQGVWNTIIFFSTGWKAMREELRAKMNYLRGIPRGQKAADAVRNERQRAVELDRRINRQGNDDDASSELSATTTVCRSYSCNVAREESVASL